MLRMTECGELGPPGIFRKWATRHYRSMGFIHSLTLAATEKSGSL